MPLTRVPQNGKSHVMGTTDAPLIEKTIPEVLADAVAMCGDQEAAVFPHQDIRMTYRQFAEEVDKLASGLSLIHISEPTRPY